MLKSGNFLLFFLALLCFSCIHVQFENPQPLKIKSLRSFPDELVGKYSDTLTINPHYISFSEPRKGNFPIIRKDSIEGIKVKDSLIYFIDFDAEKGYTYSIKDDSIYYDVIVTTKIEIGNKLVLKKFKGNYYVNVKLDDSPYWDLNIIKILPSGDLMRRAVAISENSPAGLDNGNDSLNFQPNNQSELSDLKKITPFKQIGEDSYVINPSRKQLKQLIEKGMFSSQDTLVKIQ